MSTCGRGERRRWTTVSIGNYSRWSKNQEGVDEALAKSNEKIVLALDYDM